MQLLYSYSVRNMRRRPWRTVMTVAGISLTVFATVLMLSLARGISVRNNGTGEDDNVLVISRNGQTVMFSKISDEELVHLWDLPGTKETADGELLISPEILHMSHVRLGDGLTKKRVPITIRGVTPIAYEVHRQVKLIEGTLPENERDIAIGKMAHVRFGVPEESLAIGTTLSFEKETWTICGRFEAGGSIVESEMWLPLDTLKTTLRRRSCTFVVMSCETAEIARKNCEKFGDRGVLNKYFKGWVESGYYYEFSKSLNWVLWLSAFMVVAIIIAGALIGVNTMYTAIMNRMGEFGTLRVLGFRRRDIFLTLILESLFISMAGGVVGCLGGVFLNEIPFNFSDTAFYLVVDMPVLGVGLGLSCMIGVVGATLPAFKGFRIKILDALRQG